MSGQAARLRRDGAGFTAGAALVLSAASGAAAASGAGMVLSAALGLVHDGEQVAAVLIPGIVLLATGVLGLVVVPTPSGEPVSPVAGLGSVTLAWVLAAAVGSIPFIVSGVLSSPLDAYFEAMSGFSTTGATLIDDVDATPDAILAWRSVSQWLGGVGIVVLIVAIAPTLTPGLQRYFYAEASGIGDSRLTPRIADTAKIVGGVYLGLTAMAALSYLVAGMTAFDAVNHAMTTLATGGFSTHTVSFAYFDSIALQIVAIVFMAAGAINFAFYWRVVKGGPLMPQLAEVRVYLALLAVGIIAITVSLLSSGDVRGWAALEAASFTVTSLGSTTGFTTLDFDLWGSFAAVVLVLLMIIGGSAGSTAGGVKVIRAALIGKSVAQELHRQTEPRVVSVLRLGGRVFNENVRRAVLSFFTIYVGVFALGVIVFTASGIDEVSAIGGVAATMNSVGPGLGQIGGLENYGALADGGRVMAIFLMLTGRLEIFTVVALIAAGARKLSRL